MKFLICTCAPGRGVNDLSSDSYPAGELLPIYFPSGWKWSDHLAYNGIYIFLPMPDSYSNEDVYKMRFGDKFMHYGAEEEHGIGIALHYDSGPVNLNFYRCKSVDPTTCSDVVKLSPKILER